MGIVIGQRSTRRARARRTKVALGGVAGWAMVALMTAMGPMFAAPDPAVLLGTYEETTRGLARQAIVSKGVVELRRVSTVDTLQ